MPSNTTTVAINIVNGLGQFADQKIDSEQSPLVVENAHVDILGRLTKKQGATTLSQDYIGTSSGTIASGLALASLSNRELLLFGDNKMFSFLPDLNKWLYKAALPSVSISTTPIVRNSAQQTAFDSCVYEGLQATIWEDSRGGVRAQVNASATGTPILSDFEVVAAGLYPRVLGLGHYIYFFYTVSGSLYWKRLSVTTPTSISAATLVSSDFKSSDPFWDIKEIGGAAVVVYADASSEITMFYLDIDGVAGQISTGFPNPLTIAEAPTAGLCCHVFTGTDDIEHIAIGWHNTSGGIRAAIFRNDFTTDVDPIELSPTTTTIHNLTCCENDSTGASIRFFWEYRGTSSYDAYVQTNTLSLLGVAGTASTLIKTVGIGCQAFFEADKSHVGLVYDSEEQGTFFIVDSSGKVVAKLAGGSSGGFTAKKHLPKVTDLTGNIWSLPIGVRGRFVSQIDSSESFTTLKGIHSATLDFSPDLYFKPTQLGDGLYMGGGFLRFYDGASLVEDNFHLYPEGVTLSDSNAFAIAVTLAGDGGNPETTTVTFTDGNTLSDGQYFLLYSASDATAYAVVGRKDGSSTAPVISGKTNIYFNFLGSNTAAEVAEAAKLVLHAHADFSATRSGAVITITNAANGATTNASNVSFGVGSLESTGVYSYYVVYRWDDNNGQRHRSFPSVLTATTLSGGTTIGLKIKTLQISDKQNVVVEIYRNEDAGITFYQITSPTAPLENDTSVDYVHFTDTVGDSDVTDGEVIYTAGGVVENFPAPATDIILNHKERLWIIDSSNLSTVRYSKRRIPGKGVEFTDEGVISFETPGPITALVPLDDKLVLFKESSIAAVVGEGPDQTGNGVFSNPEIIHSDIGCINPASVLVINDGLLFESRKGIYKLSRNLQIESVGRRIRLDYPSDIIGNLLRDEKNEVEYYLEDGTTLVYNYQQSFWMTRPADNIKDATNFAGVKYQVTSGGKVYKADASFKRDGAHYRMRYRTGWIRLADANGSKNTQGMQRAIELAILGEFKSHHYLKVSVFNDYKEAATQVQYFNTTPNMADGNTYYGDAPTYGTQTPYGGAYTNTYPLRLRIKQQRCECISVEVEEIPQPGETGESFQLNQFTLEGRRAQRSRKVGAKKSI